VKKTKETCPAIWKGEKKSSFPDRKEKWANPTVLVKPHLEKQTSYMSNLPDRTRRGIRKGDKVFKNCSPGTGIGKGKQYEM